MEEKSLVDLCILVIIDNLEKIEDVGDTDSSILEKILVHCNEDQLKRIELSSQGRDLSDVTDELWRRFYHRRWGAEAAHAAEAKMKGTKFRFTWKKLWDAKEREFEAHTQRSLARFKEAYQHAQTAKQGRMVQVCAALPPPRKQKGGANSGAGSSRGGSSSAPRGRLLEKARKAYASSSERLRYAAIRNKAAHLSSVPQRPGAVGAKGGGTAAGRPLQKSLPPGLHAASSSGSRGLLASRSQASTSFRDYRHGVTSGGSGVRTAVEGSNRATTESLQFRSEHSQAAKWQQHVHARCVKEAVVAGGSPLSQRKMPPCTSDGKVPSMARSPLVSPLSSMKEVSAVASQTPSRPRPVTPRPVLPARSQNPSPISPGTKQNLLKSMHPLAKSLPSPMMQAQPASSAALPSRAREQALVSKRAGQSSGKGSPPLRNARTAAGKDLPPMKKARTGGAVLHEVHDDIF